MPLVVDQLKALNAQNAQNEQRARELKASLDRVAESQSAQSSQLQWLTSGGLTFRLEAPVAPLALAPARWPQGQPAYPRLPLAGTRAVPAPLSVAGSSRYTSARASVRGSPPPPPSSVASPGPELGLDLDPRPAPAPPAYRMCRAVRTVKALWREWTVGLRDSPSIGELDSRYGSRWRAGRQNEL